MRYLTVESLKLIASSAEIRPDLRFRPARPSDFSVLHTSCYEDRPLSQFKESFERSLRQQSRGVSLHLVVEKGGEIVGSGQIVAYRHQDKAEIADLAVATAQQGRGIGTALIDVLTKVAERAGCAHLEIGVMAGNTRALALYRRLGFERVREIPLPGEARAFILRKEVREEDGPERIVRHGDGKE